MGDETNEANPAAKVSANLAAVEPFRLGRRLSDVTHRGRA